MPLPVSTRRERRAPLALALLAIFGLVIPAGVFAAKPPLPDPVTIQILNVSDWHGQLDPSNGVGGAWSISKRWAADRVAYPTLTLTAGDDYGATPALSGFFNEEPAVKAERMMGIQVGTFGNHNFDRGTTHLQQMINLAGAPSTGNTGAAPGQPFRYVASNMKNLSANLTGVDPIAYFNVGGLKVAVIGIVNEEAPTLVTPGNFGTIVITDGVAAATKFATIARKAGANVVLVITHKGMRTTSPTPTGELLDFANALPEGLVDVVFGDHTDIQYKADLANGVLIHENRSKGVSYAKTIITARPGRGGTVSAKAATFVTPSAPARSPGQLLAAECPDPSGGGTAPFCDPDILAMLAPYRTDLAVFLDPKVAVASSVFQNDGTPRIQRVQESALGDLIADGMRWFQGSDFALVTGGGIRDSLISSYTPLDTNLDRTFPTADVVIGDIYTILPFTNTILRRDVTGAQVWDAIERGVSALPGVDGRFAQVSGLKYTVDCSLAVGSRITSLTDEDDNAIPDDGTIFTIALTNFNNQGGDGYTMFVDGNAGTNEKLDAAVFQDYVTYLGGGGYATLDPTTYQPYTRITKVNC